MTTTAATRKGASEAKGTHKEALKEIKDGAKANKEATRVVRISARSTPKDGAKEGTTASTGTWKKWAVKAEICTFYAKGQCREGVSCRFRHIDKDEGKCMYSHVKRDVTEFKRKVVRTASQLCLVHINTDSCWHGDSCTFLHVKEAHFPVEALAGEDTETEKTRLLANDEREQIFNEEVERANVQREERKVGKMIVVGRQGGATKKERSTRVDPQGQPSGEGDAKDKDREPRPSADKKAADTN